MGSSILHCSSSAGNTYSRSYELNSGFYSVCCLRPDQSIILPVNPENSYIVLVVRISWLLLLVHTQIVEGSFKL